MIRRKQLRAYWVIAPSNERCTQPTIYCDCWFENNVKALNPFPRLFSRVPASRNASIVEPFPRLFSYLPRSRTASVYTQIEGVGKAGTRTFRSSFKVSASIPAVDTTGGTQVAMVAMVYRISREGGKQNVKEGSGKFRNPGEAELVVVLKRRGGHYHR